MAGNIGAELVRGDFTLDVLGYYFGSYRVAGSQDTAARTTKAEILQARRTSEPSLFRSRLTWRARTPVDDLTLRHGIQNVLNRRAPLTVSSHFQTLPFSPYGDPRGRRFEVTIGRQF